MMTQQRLQRDRYGLPLSTRSSAAAEHYIDAVDLVLSGNLGAETRLQQAIEEDEGFALAHATLASINLRSRREDQARIGIERARLYAQGTTRRERQHVKVIAEATFGNPTHALALALEHLDEFPSDAFILQQFTFLRLGGGCREMKAVILDTVEQLAPAYGDDWFYTGTRSFYLHELNRMAESRHYAEASLASNPRNGNAAHSLAHCFYETSDYLGGLEFLDGWLDGYQPEGPHYPHLNWHIALFELVQGRYQRSLKAYRESIRPSVLSRQNNVMGPPLADATSIFWRYKLYDVPERFADDWREIEDFASEVAAGPPGAFNDAHCAFAFAATGNDGAMTALIDKLQSASEAGDVLAREVTLPLVLGIDAFGRGAYKATVRHIEPVIDDIPRIPGSRAQRVVFEETLLRAYLLIGQHERAEGVLRKRLEHRHSGRDFYWLAEAEASRGDRILALADLERGSAEWRGADSDAPELQRASMLLEV